MLQGRWERRVLVLHRGVEEVGGAGRGRKGQRFWQVPGRRSDVASDRTGGDAAEPRVHRLGCPFLTMSRPSPDVLGRVDTKAPTPRPWSKATQL